jgi:hypothetical protein
MMTPELLADVMENVVAPTVRELARRDIDYRGVLYAGVMLTSKGPKLLEYNARFGDPETQVLVPLYGDEFFDLLLRPRTAIPAHRARATSSRGSGRTANSPSRSKASRSFTPVRRATTRASSSLPVVASLQSPASATPSSRRAVARIAARRS